MRRPSWSAWLSVALFVVLLAVYVPTLMPGVGWHGDTPKLQWLGRHLGISHPTGFPTYLMVNHLFVRVMPFGSLAWKSNLLSAVLTAATAGVLLPFLRGLGLGLWPALAAAAAFGLTRTMWLESLGAEVYTLQLLFVAVTVHLLVRWRTTGADRPLRWALLVYAISFGNHLMSIMLVPALAYLILRTRPGVLVRKDVAGWILLVVLLGAAQYGYLFWRSASPGTPYVEHEITNFGEFWSYVTGAKYHGRMFSMTPEQILTLRLPSVLKIYWREFGPLLALCVVGAVRMRDGVVRDFLLIYLATAFFWGLNYRIEEVHVYFLPTFLILAIFLGVGLEAAAGWLKLGRRRYLPAVLLAVPVALLALNRNEVDQSGNTTAAQGSEALLDFVGGRALLISSDYNSSQYLWYYLIGEGRGDERQIFLMHHFDPYEVRGYLAGTGTIHLPEQRRDVPPGLAVYCFSRDRAEALTRAGLRVQTAAGNVLRVLPADSRGPGR